MSTGFSGKLPMGLTGAVWFFICSVRCGAYIFWLDFRLGARCFRALRLDICGLDFFGGLGRGGGIASCGSVGQLRQDKQDSVSGTVSDVLFVSKLVAERRRFWAGTGQRFWRSAYLAVVCWGGRGVAWRCWIRATSKPLVSMLGGWGTPLPGPGPALRSASVKSMRTS